MSKRQRDRHRKERKRKIALEYAYKVHCGCKKCGKNKGNLTYHHRNPEAKIKEIRSLCSGRASISKIAREISKCDVICLEHHREIHDGKAGPDLMPWYGKIWDWVLCKYLYWKFMYFYKHIFNDRTKENEQQFTTKGNNSIEVVFKNCVELNST